MELSLETIVPDSGRQPETDNCLQPETDSCLQPETDSCLQPETDSCLQPEIDSCLQQFLKQGRQANPPERDRMQVTSMDCHPNFAAALVARIQAKPGVPRFQATECLRFPLVSLSHARINGEAGGYVRKE